MTTTPRPMTDTEVDEHLGATISVAARLGVGIAELEEALARLRLTFAAHPSHPAALEELAGMTLHNHPHQDPLVCSIADAIASEFEAPRNDTPTPLVYAPRPGDLAAEEELAALAHRAARRATRLLEDFLAQ